MTTINETLAREILDRLTRVEAATAENGRRIDDTNQRITELGNLLLEAIRQVSERNAEAIRQVSERNAEAIRQNAEAIAQAREESREANAQAREENRATNARIDRLAARVDRLFYAIIGVGAAVVATLAATQFAM